MVLRDERSLQRTFFAMNALCSEPGTTSHKASAVPFGFRRAGEREH
jgi:hypothetical protein